MGKGSLNFGFLTEDVKISRKKFLAVTLLSSSSFAWFFIMYVYFNEMFSNSPMLFMGEALFLFFSAFSSLLGSLVSEKIPRKQLLGAWIVFGVLVTASLAAFQGTELAPLVGALLGLSFGIGFPSCWAALADCTVVEERGRVSGMAILMTFVLVIVATLAKPLIGLVLAGVILRSLGFLTLAVDPCKRQEGRNIPWGSILGHGSFALYLLPWIMFNVANGLVSFVRSGLPLPQSPEWSTANSLGNTLHYVGTGVFALISGIAADRVGRKQPIIIGLIMLGVSYVFLGLATSSSSWLIFLTTSGFAWGLIMVVYIAIPGDIAGSGAKERFYALGAIIPLILYMSFSSISESLGISAPVTIVSSILSIILFVSVVPVFRASETLPENKLRARKLKEHVERIGKLVEESRKGG